MTVTRKMCHVVGALTAFLGLTVVIISAIYLDKCLELHKLYVPKEHLQSGVTVKSYRVLITIAMVGLFGGVAQCLMGLTMYWGIDTKKASGNNTRIYLFCTGQALNLMLLVVCLSLAIYFKSYEVSRSLIDKNLTKNTEGNEQVPEIIGGIYCIVLGVDLPIVTICLLFFGLKLKKAEYHGMH